jgi:hypothetical protein
MMLAENTMIMLKGLFAIMSDLFDVSNSALLETKDPIIHSQEVYQVLSFGKLMRGRSIQLKRRTSYAFCHRLNSGRGLLVSEALAEIPNKAVLIHGFCRPWQPESTSSWASSGSELIRIERFS